MKIIIFICILMSSVILTQAQNVEFVGSYDNLNHAFNVFAVGNIVYVADWYEGLQIIDVTNQTNPILMGTYNTSGWAWKVSVSGDYAYVADWASGVEIINIADPTAPIHMANFDTPGNARDIETYGNYAFISDDSLGLMIIDISNPANPSLISSYEFNGATDAYKENNFIYMINDQPDYYTDFIIIDIEDLTDPILEGTYRWGSRINGVVVSGDYAYLAAYNIGIVIFDISDPSRPGFAGDFHTPGRAFGIYLQNEHIYIADYDWGMRIINISNPINPRFAGSYNTPGESIGIYALADDVYVADVTSLQILRFPRSVIDDKASPNIVSLSQNYPNPFNAHTLISYSLPKSSDVTIDIFDIMGRKIDVISLGMQIAGEHEVTWEAENQSSSGVYFYRIKAGDYSETRMMVLMK